MKTTIDKAGRLVVPKTIREAAHLTPGAEVEIRLVEGRVEIEPAAMDIQLERRGRLVVGVPIGPTEVLTEEEVEEIISKVASTGTSSQRWSAASWPAGRSTMPRRRLVLLLLIRRPQGM